MYKHTRRKSSILAIVIVAAATLTLLTYTSLANSALAAKSSSLDKRGFKNLAACEINAANAHSGQLTESEAMDCYLQAFSASPISSTSVVGHNGASPNNALSGNTNSTGSTSTNLSPADSFSSHTSHHHLHASGPNNSTSNVMNSNIGQ